MNLSTFSQSTNRSIDWIAAIPRRLQLNEVRALTAGSPEKIMGIQSRSRIQIRKKKRCKNAKRPEELVISSVWKRIEFI